MSFDLARRVADAVLYEGYVLYPYRASSAKNRVRWQFGVVATRDSGDASGGDSWFQQTEVLIELPAAGAASAPAAAAADLAAGPRTAADAMAADGAVKTPAPAGDRGEIRLDLRVRFLQVQLRTVQVLDAASGEYQAVERLELGGETLVTWEEGCERQVDWPDLRLADLLAEERQLPFQIAGGREVETVSPGAAAAGLAAAAGDRILGAGDGDGGAGNGAGVPAAPVPPPRAQVVRQRWPLCGVLRAAAFPAAEQGAPGFVRLRVRVENHTPWDLPPDSGRDQTTRRSLVGAHTLLAVRGAQLVSATDPPASAAGVPCSNLHTWPVLIGEGRRDLLLSSPIILGDYPEVAPESPGDLYDATEIDEILTLRVMTLTEAEKREARATDARAAAVIERSDTIPSEIFERLHGAIRYLGAGPGQPQARSGPEAAGADVSAFGAPFDPFAASFGLAGAELPAVGGAAFGPFAPAAGSGESAPAAPPIADALAAWLDEQGGGEDAATAAVEVGGVQVGKGARVVLRPSRRADAMDMFMDGRAALVEGVFRDVDGATYVAVTLTDDPAGELHGWYGRYFYFYPEEIEPISTAAPGRLEG